VGFRRFNAAPLIKLKKAPRKTAQRLLSQVELHLLLRAARSKRDRIMLEVAYFGALRVRPRKISSAYFRGLPSMRRFGF
jgi:hypothetical protein